MVPYTLRYYGTCVLGVLYERYFFIPMVGCFPLLTGKNKLIG